MQWSFKYMRIKYIGLLLLCSISLQAALAQTSKLRELQDSLRLAKDSSTYVRLLNDLSYYYYMSNLDSCFWYAVKAKEMATRLNNQRELSNAYNNLGIFYSKKRNATLAILYDYEALKIRYVLRDSAGICTFMNNLSMDYESDSNMVMKEYYEQQALQLGNRLPGYKGYSVLLMNYVVDYWRDTTKKDSVQWAMNRLCALTADKPYTHEWYHARIFEVMEIMRGGRGKEGEQQLNKLAEEAYKKGLLRIPADVYEHMLEDIIPMGYKADSIRYAEKLFSVAKESGDYILMMYAVEIIYPYYLSRGNKAKLASLGDAVRELAASEHTESVNLPTTDYIGYFLNEQQMQELQLSNQLQQQAIAESDLHKVGHRTLLKFLAALLLLLVIYAVIYYWFYYSSRRAARVLAMLNTGITEKNIRLQANDDFKNKLLSFVARDFRAPLNEIISTAESWQQQGSPDNDTILTSITSVETASRRTLRLFDGILYWIKSQFPGFIYTPGSFNTREMLAAAIQGIQSEATGKQLQIVLEIPDNLTMAADQEMLAFVHHTLLQHTVALITAGGTMMITALLFEGKIQVTIKGHPVVVTPALLYLLDLPQDDRLILITCKDFMIKMGGSMEVMEEGKDSFGFVYTLPKH
ncbi:signal transduction histidine kinase [Chitinophaga niastensis]|uniref:Signal transduction histidine kinase n=2 Tax=Chitinophaga niastensis TaxID=536980 RepID=A0A2P8HAU8_CHINA|nr:signal transduction histidine kinase [Chitinophaga niastensis]